jgi:hypothetical protein
MATPMKCINHTARDAFIRCRQCSKPVCQECVIKDEIGVYCSEDCAEKGKSFHQRAEAASQNKKIYGGYGKYLKQILLLLILIAIIIGLWKNGPEPVQSFLDPYLNWIPLP